MKYLKQWKQDGNWRIRLRRPGFKEVELKPPPGYRGDKATLSNSPKFLAAYLAAMAEPVAPLKPGEKRSTYGTVAWLVGEYLGSLDYLGRPKSARVTQRRHLDDFRVRRGDLPVARIEQEHLEKMFAKMIETPARANEWLASMRDLMKYAVKRKLLAANPALDIKKRAAKSADGFPIWAPEQVATAREKFAIGVKMRLAIEMINALAFRRSDVIRVGPPDVRDGVLKYTCYKGRERSPSVVEVPMPSELMAIIRKTPGTGLKTWLVDDRGRPFNETSFSKWFAQEVARAGLPARCTPHGLRKRCLTDLGNSGKTVHQIMAVSGHMTLKEVERYTRMADRARNARGAIDASFEQLHRCAVPHNVGRNPLGC